ncbi:hypothetical protein [Flammeovirga aprica]|uniref:Uncharacterized protein n=1 Tax=Flammeovirga aprica JL-4 TaxID=694437 RepID=A0A7X9S0B1_9BACT|nr:hypothetical protein [Flammeovirga aprica]NME72092.1 hypothetical protein [Flammeovirga aprica JL-4]
MIYLPQTSKTGSNSVGYFFLILSFFYSNFLSAQQENGMTAVRSTLYNFSYIDFNMDFYKFASDQYLLSHTGNGTLQLSGQSFLNLEYNFSNSWQDNFSFMTMGDFSVTYTRNFYSKNYQKGGFQGVATSLKVILPTGKSKYLSGFDNWILEPSVYFGWKLHNHKNYIASKFRLNFPLATLPDAFPSIPFGRYEATFGYEDQNLWVASTIDNRLTLDHWEYNLLHKFELGVKLDKTNGVFGSTTNRIIGEGFYEYYINFGYYKVI